METLDSYEAPHVRIRLACEGADAHDSPPRIYRVTVDQTDAFGTRTIETVCETPFCGIANARFSEEARKAYRAGEIDGDWLEEAQDWGAEGEEVEVSQ